MARASPQGLRENPETLSSMRVEVPRARRYALHLLLRYRTGTSAEWQDGRTENISSSGVLFEGTPGLQLNDLVELNMTMPGTVDDTPSRLVCVGRVVRHQDQRGASRQPAFAVAFSDYRISRPVETSQHPKGGAAHS